MTRFLGAYLWLRWRLGVGTLKLAARRGLGEGLASAAGLLVPVLVGGALLALATGLAVLAARGGALLAGGGPGRAPVLFTLRAATAVVTLVLIVLPAGRGMARGGGEEQRLRLLPIARSRLHAIRVAGALADPWILVVSPGLLALSAGALATGGALVATLTLVASLLLLASWAGLSSIVASVAQVVLRDRQRAELASLAGLVLLFGASLLVLRIEPGSGRASLELASRFPEWLQLLPSETHAMTVAHLTEGRVGDSLLGLALSAALAAVLVLSSWRLALVVDDVPHGRRARGASRPVRSGFARLPLAPSLPVRALAAASLRSGLRSVKVRGAILVAPLTIAAVILLLRFSDGLDGTVGASLLSGETLALGAIALGLLGGQCVMFNQIAVDGTGLGLELTAPVTERQLLAGKAVAGFVLFAACCVPGCLVVAAMVPVPAGRWPAIALAALSAQVLSTPVAAWSSILFPRRADLSTLGSDGNPHQLSMLIGTVSAAATLAPAWLPFALVRDGGVLAGIELAWLGVTVLCAAPALAAAAAALEARREVLLRVATGR